MDSRKSCVLVFMLEFCQFVRDIDELVFMEPGKKRRVSPVWKHFEQISPDKVLHIICLNIMKCVTTIIFTSRIFHSKVKCLLGSKQLGYNNNTSSMLRHYRACHENNEGNGIGPAKAVTRKEELDEALVSMIVKDTQPFSIVEDKGFRDFVAKLDPTYVLPTRKAGKAMAEAKYQQEKEKAKAEVLKVPAVSLTADMWTSLNMDAYLAVTCHFIDDNTCLKSTLLGVVKFPQAHTAENLACVKSSLMEEWGIKSKVTCLVTDGASNMIACGKNLKLCHAVCIAHTLNLVVKKALELTPVLSTIRTKARKLVGYFRSSTTAKEKLDLVQEHMGKPKKKLIQEVETRWNSTFQMLERVAELREPVGAALAGLQTDIAALTSDDYNNICACLSILSPFHEATIELSEEKKVSGSKVVPLLKMVEKMLQEEAAKATVPVARELGEHLIRLLRERLDKIQSMSIMSLATLLDPRYKSLG
ncbi:E3 SUMO-protein ligase ZBED1-like [Brachyhypopomus gauderio]|uniref:E3 SUMO-protein ligase ZBED1-like n=1 Tax=Brachyhypopomus gauderio TaxID=698409 RepID=UPI004042F6A9